MADRFHLEEIVWKDVETRSHRARSPNVLCVAYHDVSSVELRLAANA